MDRYDCLYEKYRSQMSTVISDGLAAREEFQARFASKLEGMHLIELNSSNAGEGFLYYVQWTDEVTHCYVPVYGYFAESEKTMVKLFQKLADTVVNGGVCDFSIHLYSGDTACISAFHMMQFGNMSEKCVKLLESKDITGGMLDIRVLEKEEIERHWKVIWDATENIVKHLRCSPVFYPGNEFTEEVYHDYYTSDSLELIAAYDNGKLAGIIEWNAEDCEMVGKEGQSANVGEAFVYPAYRGTGLAEKLLGFAELRAVSEGYRYMWVEHGTANPNARGFWNKYFTTYQYELVRRIG